MGSLTSRPKTPATIPQQVVYVPQQTSTPAPSNTSQAQTQQETQELSAEEQNAESRTQNLLTRERGRYGTVNTSFRGLLSLAGTGGQGKTLLGE